MRPAGLHCREEAEMWSWSDSHGPSYLTHLVSKKSKDLIIFSKEAE